MTREELVSMYSGSGMPPKMARAIARLFLEKKADLEERIDEPLDVVKARRNPGME